MKLYLRKKKAWWMTKKINLGVDCIKAIIRHHAHHIVSTASVTVMTVWLWWQRHGMTMSMWQDCIKCLTKVSNIWTAPTTCVLLISFTRQYQKWKPVWKEIETKAQIVVFSFLSLFFTYTLLGPDSMNYRAIKHICSCYVLRHLKI